MIDVPLYYTSFLFGSVVVHAYTVRLAWLHHMYLLVTMLSILNHAKWFDSYPGKLIVQTTDKTLAHTIAALLIINIMKTTVCITIAKIGFWYCIATVAAIFYVPKDSNSPAAFRWHAVLHTVSTIGTHCAIVCIKKNVAI